MSQKVKKSSHNDKNVKKGLKFIALLNKESVKAEMKRLAENDAIMATSAK